MNTTEPAQPHAPVAIIGVGCRLPGGITEADQLWKALVQGRDCLTRIPEDRWKAMVERLHPTQVPAEPFPAGIVEHAFDHGFFGITADEAAEMDPQQGWLLEVTYEALADAGIAPASLSGSRAGVYVGAASIDQAAENFALGHRAGVFTASGAGMAILANRISHVLDLDGPSLALDTACSSSLTALHYALRDLRAGDVDLALVGGSNVLTNPVITASFAETGVLAPNGRCKPFDQAADGYVRSEGAVVLALTRAALATERGHRVWAHVAGTGIGHGGRAPHLLAPRAERQGQAIRRALADAGVRAAHVGWVQAHGTGTKAGDRVEARGIAEALGQDVPVAVGSVKGRLGHLEGAAGLLGVMVAALTVHNGQIPPTSHHQRLREGLEELVRVPTKVEEWPVLDGRKRVVAGVSSFGFGGANAHAILTQASPVEPPSRQDPMPLPETVLVSAHSPAALASAAGRLATTAPQGGSVGVVADTALAHGSHGRYRSAVVVSDLGALVQGLRALQDGTPDPHVLPAHVASGIRPRLVFVYSGHGGHHQAAGAALMGSEAFAGAVEETRAALTRRAGYQVWAPGEAITSFVDAQHCTFLVQSGLTALLAERGIEPDLVLGHSVGEVAAAHTAGVLTLDSASRVLAERSRLLSGIGDVGGLIAVRATVDEVDTFTSPYDGRIVIASYSAPRVQVVAGPTADLDHLQGFLVKEGVWCKRVSDVVPAHSPAIDPLVPALREALAGLVPHPARVSILSTSQPGPAPAPASLWSPTYWAEQARRPVRFTEAMRDAASAVGDHPVVFVEIGPRALLSEHIAHTLAGAATVAITSAPSGPAHGIGRLYTLGVVPTGPTGRAHPHLTVPPGWDHGGASARADQDGPPPVPAPDQVQAHLLAEVARLVHAPEGLDVDGTWIESGLGSHGLLQLTSRLRRIPPWAQVDIQLFLPDRTWREVAMTLVERLTDPHKATTEGAPSVLP